MKILQVNCVYDQGSTGIITASIHRALLAAGHGSVVCYGRRQAPREPFVHKVCNDFFGKVNHGIAMVTGFMYGGCLFSTGKLISIIKNEKPDLVHLQCINGNFVNIYRLVEWLKQSGIPTVLTIHAEFMYTANCGYSLGCEGWKQGCVNCPHPKKATGTLFVSRTAESFEKMRRAFAGFDRLTIVGPSEWICRQADQSAVLSGKTFKTIYNGIDTKTFSPACSNSIRQKCSISGEEKLILFVTATFDETKGADRFLELANSFAGMPYRFVVAGVAAPADAPENVRFLGRIDSRSELTALYAAADAAVICSRLDNYPTVCLESAACGTPVVGFDVGGVAEAIGNGMGRVVPDGDIGAMHTALEAVCAVPKSDWQRKASPLSRSLSDEHMCRSYLALYEEILKGE